MRKTDKLVLPLFDPDDRILREDFNQAAQTLDEKIGLTEEVCAILDLPEEATPADALLKLALGPGRYAYILTVVYPDGTPVVNRTVSGVKDVYGNTPVTNENGRAVAIAEAEDITVSVESEYLDLKPIENQKIEAAGFVTHKNLCLEKNTGDYLLVTASKTYELSPYVRSMDVTAVGGGGGSAGSQLSGGGNIYGDSGGGGGYAVHALDYDVRAHKKIKVEIGAGGAGGKSGYLSDGLPLSGCRSWVWKNGIISRLLQKKKIWTRGSWKRFCGWWRWDFWKAVVAAIAGHNRWKKYLHRRCNRNLPCRS